MLPCLHLASGLALWSVISMSIDFAAQSASIISNYFTGLELPHCVRQ
jgi:hypothetical protein